MLAARRTLPTIVLVLFTLLARAEEPKFKALAFYNTNVERAHMNFAKDALAFYTKLAAEKQRCIFQPDAKSVL